MSRQPLKILNNTHYFDINRSKAFVKIANPSSYAFRQAKQEGYELRLYWEFRYCKEHNGQTFYYTLTYNDKSLPYYEGVPCFDYKDLSGFLNGGFRKKLLRSYGTTFKYFVGAELGEGKGSRGMENNPHYHILFFLRSADSDKYPYKLISPIEFRSLVRRYWQTFDQDIDGYHDFRTTGFGVAKEGDFIGLVSDFRAVSYVCKYVTKDVHLLKAEKQIKDVLFSRYYAKFFNDDRIQNNFLVDYVYPRFSVTNNVNDYSIDFYRVCLSLAPNLSKQCGPKINKDINWYFSSFLDESHLKQDFDNYLLSLIEDEIRLDINIYRNRYCNKCRISQGVGLYGLDFLDEGNFTIPVPTKDGFVNRNINLYYYRKLFYDVVKDPFGQNCYILNEKGIDMKVNNLERSAKNLTDRLRSYLDVFNEDIFEDALSSDLVHNVDKVFLPLYLSALSDYSNKDKIDNLINDYAYFKLVYEGRFFKVKQNRLDKTISYPPIDFKFDYRSFLQPSYYSTHYDSDGFFAFSKLIGKVFSPYSSHPYFSSSTSYFALFDLLFDYFFVNKDKEIEDKVNEIKVVKKFHDKLKLKSYYSNLNLNCYVRS